MLSILNPIPGAMETLLDKAKGLFGCDFYMAKVTIRVDLRKETALKITICNLLTKKYASNTENAATDMISFIRNSYFS